MLQINMLTLYMEGIAKIHAHLPPPPPFVALATRLPARLSYTLRPVRFEETVPG